ncbi:seryl-tRNA synthetase [Grosmannia clavigera kw1407]|uniref:serine--tRNA ligase n=1 Tax=Grosmannia clavigera (strain kw1407 / UAMH 11150) TaxID=655863 RepID=F0XA28_GROCL|nr:seryl-tRNA synthetase [Grosmannia clavigera kw1407]EFX05348.1 seryl-tRNA synthetase [Grosmannia clavigera kw1407]
MLPRSGVSRAMARLALCRCAGPVRWANVRWRVSSDSTPTRLPVPASCLYSSSASSPRPARPPPRPATGPRANIDLRHIRQNAELHAANCVRRNYGALRDSPARIVDLFAAWQTRQHDGRALREEANVVRRRLANPPVAREVEEVVAIQDAQCSRDTLLERARVLKQQLAGIEADEAHLTAEMQQLAAALPNLTSTDTPDGMHTLLCYINCDGEAAGEAVSLLRRHHHNTRSGRWRSHVHIGTELGLLDFAAAATTSGWGWYYLLGDGARLEQALVQYAIAVAHRHGWQLVSPPSLVRSSVAAACGFQPRDQGGEQQTYTIDGAGAGGGSSPDTAATGISMSLTATAEIPLAALYADTTLPSSATSATSDDSATTIASSDSSNTTSFNPIRRVAVSRCYRAEAGARGAATKGLYRVHEFTKVELFAWTAPDLDAATEVFDELVDIQTEILSSLDLPCRVLEMPASDLGASAYRKIDIEAFFPSRCGAVADAVADPQGDPPTDIALIDAGWGEVTSASICTDYQTRRLATRTRIDGALVYPWTLNGTALAVPRIIAALLENGWDEEAKTVAIPECLQPWMDGQEFISVGNRQW